MILPFACLIGDVYDKIKKYSRSLYAWYKINSRHLVATNSKMYVFFTSVTFAIFVLRDRSLMFRLLLVFQGLAKYAFFQELVHYLELKC